MENKMPKDEYYLKIAEAVSIKSTCLSVAFGCIIVKSDQIISTGYVGSPRKTMDCMELGYCIRRKNNIKSGTGYEMCRSVHAEMNAIINSARSGSSLLDGDLYLFTAKREGEHLVKINAYPCLLCKKMIINAGINRFIGNDVDGNPTIYMVSEWIKDWQQLEDITQDKDQYFINYDKK